MKTQYKTFVVDRKAIDPDAGIYEAMISTESPDRDGDVILASGGDLTNFSKNPVVLYAHNYWDLPVAKAIEVEKLAGAGVRARFQFPEWGESEQADTVRRLWAGGFLNATSIGFIPVKWEPRKSPDGEKLARGQMITEWELLEFSIVPVPANQDALRLAAKALTPDEASAFKSAAQSAVEELITKRGRTLSAANERKIRTAVEALSAVLESLGEQEDDDGKSAEPPSVPQAAEPETDEPTETETAEPITDEPTSDASKAADVEIDAPLSDYFETLRQLFGA